METIYLSFLTGLTIGGISCLAVQGGLLASTVAGQDNLKALKTTGIFLLSKLIAYAVLGGALGLLGSAFLPSPNLLGALQIFAGIFMVITALQLLHIHPFFDRFVIQPPKWLLKFMSKETESKSFFAPVILGLFTVVIPCGTTQAMMALSISTGNPFYGAAVLIAFILGTIPTFLLLGAVTCACSRNKTLNFLTVGLIFVLGVLTINTGQILRGSPHTLQSYYHVLKIDVPSTVSAAPINAQGQQEVTINVYTNGYQSSVQTLKAGVPVKLTLQTDNVSGCSRAFVLPSLNMSRILPETGTEVVEFTPTSEGPLTYTCSMGMYTGQFTVVN